MRSSDSDSRHRLRHEFRHGNPARVELHLLRRDAGQVCILDPSFILYAYERLGSGGPRGWWYACVSNSDTQASTPAILILYQDTICFTERTSQLSRTTSECSPETLSSETSPGQSPTHPSPHGPAHRCLSGHCARKPSASTA